MIDAREGAIDAAIDAAALLFRWSELPLITAALPGVGGIVRSVADDFRVEEIPAYLPEGRGSFLYLLVEKRGLTTRDLVLALTARGLKESEVGVAGLKDKAAVTVQWLSLPKREAEAVAALEQLPGVRILERSYHRNKLGIGHLHGNRFVVRIRGVGPDAAARAQPILAALAAEGVPNYFGPQRFGRYGANALDGLRALAGERLPGGPRLQRFFVSALQSLIFNRLLASRIAAGLYARVVTGDWARKHDTGGTFLVEDGEAESARAQRFEISATLPLYGRRVQRSTGDAGALEGIVLDGLGLRWSSFGSRRGDRRSSRVRLADASVRPFEGGLELAFSLPKGSYATVVLRELTKLDVDAPLPWPPAPLPRPAEGSAPA